MILELKRWFAPPIFPNDESKTRRAGLLYTALLVVLAFTTLMILGNLLGGKTSASVIVMDEVGFVLAVGLLFLLYRGEVHLTSVISLVLSFGFITASSAMLGTIRTPTTALYFFLIVAASLLYEARGLVFSVLASSIAVAGLVWAENAKVLPPADFTVSITQWITWTTLFAFGGGFIYWGFRSIQLALARADNELAERQRAEKALKDSELKYRALIENSGASVFSVDRNGVFNFVSQVFAKNLGHSPEYFIGKTFWDIYPKELADLRQEINRKVFETGEIQSTEGVVPLPGKNRYFMVKANPVKDETGNVVLCLVYATDITERMRMEEALRESEASLKFSQQIAHVGHWNWDTIRNSVVWSDEMYHIFGLDPKNFTGDLAQVIAQSIHPDDREKVDAANDIVLTEQRPAPMEYRVVWPDQSVHTVWAAPGAQVVDADGKILKLSGIVQDVSERKKIEHELNRANLLLQAQLNELNDLHDQLREQAIRDPLTQLYNRRYLNETMPREIARALREQYSLGALMIDIDHFKNINDAYGHLVGDEALKSIANLIVANLRASDIVCRYGGEEVLCLLLDTTEEEARQRAEQLCVAIANLSLDPSHPTVRVTVSMGVAILPRHGRDMISVLKAADEALYDAKAAGRNCVRVARILSF